MPQVSQGTGEQAPLIIGPGQGFRTSLRAARAILPWKWGLGAVTFPYLPSAWRGGEAAQGGGPEAGSGALEGPVHV